MTMPENKNDKFCFDDGKSTALQCDQIRNYLNNEMNIKVCQRNKNN